MTSSACSCAHQLRTTPPPGSGTILNQVGLDHNDFGQLAIEWQDHSTAVSTSSLNVSYSYDDGGSDSNQIRLME